MAAANELTLEKLMEAGVHFGHKTSRWNPKMKPYIWGKRNGIHIIDLTQTVQLMEKSYEFLKDASAKGKKIVFVGTKKQAAPIIQEEAERVGAYFINRRWLGGTLTNFDIIRTRINRLRDLEEMRENGHMERLPKKEVAVLNRQHEKLDRSLGGMKTMRGMPDIIVVVDINRESLAVEEAQKAGVPLVCLVDTNCNPGNITKVIPGNDDAIRSIRFVISYLADAIAEGKAEREKKLSGAAVLKEEMKKGSADKPAEKVTRGKQPVATDEKTEAAPAAEDAKTEENREMAAAGATKDAE